MRTKYLHIFLFVKDCRTSGKRHRFSGDTAGELGSKPSEFVEETLGGVGYHKTTC